MAVLVFVTSFSGAYTYTHTHTHTHTPTHAHTPGLGRSRLPHLFPSSTLFSTSPFLPSSPPFTPPPAPASSPLPPPPPPPAPHHRPEVRGQPPTVPSRPPPLQLPGARSCRLKPSEGQSHGIIHLSPVCLRLCLCPCLLVSVFLSVCLCRLGMIENLSWHFTPTL